MMQLRGRFLSLEEIARVAFERERVEIAPAAHDAINASRRVVEQIVAREDVIYGVSTGFGKLADIHIPRDKLEQLQVNLVRSHSCGVGRPLSEPEVRAMMLLRANVLTLGFSGIRLEVIQLLVEMLNRGVWPVIPEKGSVGASGDLAPLAHLALSLLGEGEAFFERARLPSAEALQRAGLEPTDLQAKEGLALLNGTQAMHAVGGLALLRAKRLAHVADVAGAMTLEALKGTPVAFDARIHNARPHPGQQAAARHLLDLLRESEIRASHESDDPRVQDAYSLRCIPQVHGAVRGALAHCEEILAIESGSATDNPLVFVSGGDDPAGAVLSGGNFHGAPLALALDYAAIATTDLMSISERRTNRLTNPDYSEGLPAFLAQQPGMQSGFMIPQVVAVALLNEAKVLAHPASVDNLSTSAGREDHVSMGMTGALKLRTIVENAENVFAIELLAAAEGLEFRRPLKAGVGVERAFAIVRRIAPRLEEDRALSGDIERVAEAIRSGQFDIVAGVGDSGGEE
ncbi:MAG TPA: histidine ammonia-lyase [Chthoniobacterales bacterium]|jgi:histidine ammonia-lyase|nr:histidine ammonia-lyase [Chthoniobacterales bacterium]